MGVGRRRGFVLGLFLGLATLFVACSSGNAFVLRPPKLDVNVTELVFDAEGGAQRDFDLFSDTSWNAICDADWYSVTPTSGRDNATVAVVVQENSSNAERHATVLLKAGSASAEVKLRQGFVVCATNERPCEAKCCNNATEFCDGSGTCQPLPQPRLTRAQFSRDCSAIELLGTPGIQPLASHVSNSGSIATLCPGGVSGDDSGFRCPLSNSPTNPFVPGTHSAQWTVQDSFGGVANAAAYVFQTALSEVGPIAFPLRRMVPSATLGQDAMVGRQVLVTGNAHPSGGCWGSATHRGSIATGSSHTCILHADKTVYCWGKNENGQATALRDLLPVVAIAAGGYHSCALQTDGQVRCWGWNSHLQIEVPRELGPVVAIAAGYLHTCALQADGKVRCWGEGGFGATKVPWDLGPTVTIAAGWDHTCALKTDGKLHCWGGNSERQTVAPENLGPVVAIAAGRYHTCALQADGVVHCWGITSGANYYGQTNVPLDLGPVVALAAGEFHTCALEDRGTMRCWGATNVGQALVPAGLGQVVAIAAGDRHTCALQANGALNCWGANSSQVIVPPGMSAVVQTVGRLSIPQ
ncbi:MAG: hypothetical protein FWC28_02225 [Proteobacteria bacterium]|nr:hypothetical protein [Cystobacterineae bacterium]MCL2259466.1 hypothetical protein [Cystobacterineae bacterium]MCL2314055.1 hypothetical protein [Pseudomonadota bacterium]